jgi:hypothetical protein
VLVMTKSGLAQGSPEGSAGILEESSGSLEQGTAAAGVAAAGRAAGRVAVAGFLGAAVWAGAAVVSAARASRRVVRFWVIVCLV